VGRRWVAGPGLEHRVAGDGPGGGVVRRKLSVGSGVTVRAGVEVDQARVQSPQRRLVAAETFGNTGAVVVHESVGPGDEVMEDGLCLRLPEVEGETLLSLERLHSEPGHAGTERVAVEGLDLDYSGPQVGDERRTVGGGVHRRRLDDHEAFEGV